MKTKFALFLLLAFLCAPLLAAVPQTLAPQENRVRIAVMGQEDFHPDRTVPGNVRSLPDALAARIIEHLTATNRFEVVERTALRRVIREQQFGRERAATDVDKVIEKSLEQLPATSGWTIAAAGALADHNDRLKEFQELGTALGADYLVYAVLEKHQPKQKVRAMPYSERGRTLVTNEVDARLRLRLIETAHGRILGATSLRTRISERLFSGRESKQDAYSMFDHLGSKAALAILDMVFPARIVASDPWVINRGSNEGVRVGDRYTLVREGDEIKDSAGVVIGRLRREVAQAEVVQVQPRLAVVSVTSGTPRIDDLAVRHDSGNPRQEETPPRSGGDARSDAGGPLTLAVGRIRITPGAHNIILDQAQTGRITNDLMYKLSRFPEFDVMERAEVDQVLDEKAFVAIARDLPDDALLRELQGADYLVHTAIDDFRIRSESTRIPYTQEIQVRYFGTVKATARLVDVHTGKVASMIKIDIDDRIREVRDQETAVSNLIDRFSTDLSQQISDDLRARREGTLAPARRPAPPAPKPMPRVNRPNF